MPTSLISVIIATYNSLATLPRAVESVRHQTFPDVELIVVDDGSTDATRDYLACQKQPIRIIQQANLGPAAARNRGLSAAQGDSVMFLDADDYIAADKLSKQYHFIENHPAVGWVYCDVTYVDRDLKPLYRASEHFSYSKRPTLAGDLFAQLFQGNFIPIHAPLIRRHCLNTAGFFDEDPGLIGVEDWDFLLRLSLCAKAAYLPEPLADCVIHASSLSSDPKAREVRRYYLLDRFMNRHPESMGLLGLVGRKSAADVHNWHAYRFYKESRFRMALHRFRASLRIFPFQRKAWLLFCLTSLRALFSDQ